MDSLTLKDFIFIIMQIIVITTVVVTNKTHIGFLQNQNEDLRNCIKEMQKIITELRVKVGI
ncbi:hypothetical protein QL989_16115 [Pseudoalteromonas sp. APC 3224]|uniref:hypothetical protein n=1 Tax=Pseudoalteromonas sp. APC 3224 TaxID=3035203 RepID=UPI0025B4DA65|nr:hypothetical protein [Pseudoalteromonas sp. APC 3224]MDN3486864.1 hypothetical protein [Pseudoalteromonas sp. APC 3224]